jgi:hypothetical protein
MFNPFSRKQPKLDPRKDYEALGKQVMALYDAINPDRKGLYRTAFLKGVLTGLGSVVGATIVIALIAGILSLVGHIPFVGPITDNVRGTLEHKQ